MKFFSDVIEFLKNLSFVDIVFFFAILILMVLVVTLIYFIKINNDMPEIINEVKDDDEKLDETTEMQIVKEIEKAVNDPKRDVIISQYEKEQEDKAIISYEELVDKSSNYHLNYENEENNDNLSIKKINLEDFSGINTEKTKMEARVISFAKEEAFLEALKKLQQELG